MSPSPYNPAHDRPILSLLAYGFTRDAQLHHLAAAGQTGRPLYVTLFDGKKISLGTICAAKRCF